MDFKTSKISKYRNHNSVVNRMTKANSSDAVTPIDRVSPVTNSTALISYNSLLASDQFYDKLSKLQKEYKRFYHDQRELERALNDMEEDDECLTENMKELVEKYNMALESLREFDLEFGTIYRKDVENLLRKFKQNLSRVGVTIIDDAILKFDEEKFRYSIAHSNDALKFLFRPIKGLIINLHRTFKNIKIPKDAAYYETGESNYNGLITDEKV